MQINIIEQEILSTVVVGWAEPDLSDSGAPRLSGSAHPALSDIYRRRNCGSHYLVSQVFSSCMRKVSQYYIRTFKTVA